VRWPPTDKADYADDHRRGWSINFGRLAELFAKPTP
jgi:hypothetical protein